MSVLGRINEKFSVPIVTEKKPEPPPVQPMVRQPAGRCSTCDGSAWWLPRGQSAAWRCDACSPPLSRALVAARHDSAPDDERTLGDASELLMAGGPVCESCRSAWYVEKWNSETGVDTRCWTCGESVTGEVFDELRPAIKTKGLGVSVA